MAMAAKQAPIAAVVTLHPLLWMRSAMTDRVAQREQIWRVAPMSNAEYGGCRWS
ncbi:hypothetical protein OsI_22503 [Oryza sativa Indica Group]|uniref:Uncharacterized protein n=1 Tax=Oryza sativa subsp. indica TaxID=39946 RepID=A2YBM0_ORYSI|nr:hypothetical protein OsI_22503 [Oryza sativa Indica Group]